MADWLTVAAYLLAALLSARAGADARLRRETRDTIFWRATAVLLLLLGVNELLDMQALLTMVVRAQAQADGWYGDHRRIQYLFVAAMIVLSVIAAAAMLWLMRRTRGTVRLAMLGLAFIGLFVLLRAASFHHFNEFLGRGAAAFNLGSVQEMAGIVIVAAAAVLYARRRRPRRKRSRSR